MSHTCLRCGEPLAQDAPCDEFLNHATEGECIASLLASQGEREDRMPVVEVPEITLRRWTGLLRGTNYSLDSDQVATEMETYLPKPVLPVTPRPIAWTLDCPACHARQPVPNVIRHVAYSVFWRADDLRGTRVVVCRGCGARLVVEGGEETE